MNYQTYDALETDKIIVKNLLPEIGIEKARNEIINGLSAKKKYISSKFFYNDTGSKLFEKITDLPEYYLTRTEKEILKNIAPGMMQNFRNADIIELGSGDHSKIDILLQALSEKNIPTINYIPVDMSEAAVKKSACILTKKYPELNIEGLVADFISQQNLIPNNKKRMFCFFGSTIGNFEEKEALNFLVSLSSNMKPDDTLLLGVDFIKPLNVLHDAYNDKQGITAAFNKNILNVVNDLIHSNFSPDDFEHYAFFNEVGSRIEMHLIANKKLIVSSPFHYETIVIRKNEAIHTENSHKYSMENINKFAVTTGLSIAELYTDPQNWFAIVKFQKR